MRESKDPARSGHVARFEACEPRLVMSAQPLDQLTLDYFAETQVATPITQTAAQDQAGVTTARAEYGFTGAGQTVAVIDTGIGYDHRALGGGFGTGYKVVGGWDFAENDANPYDDGPYGSHGTHVAGIIGSTDAKYSGIAPGADLVGLRVFNDAGQSSFTWIEQALQWVHNNRSTFANPITTVNISIGTAWNSTVVPNWAMLEDEFAQLKADGIFVAVAAGNSFSQYGTTGLSYPAASPNVVPVMSVDANGALSSFSQRDTRAIAAPGRSIMSTVPDYRGNLNGRADDYVSYSGTSMAAPFLAGSSALLRQAYAFVGQANVNQDTIERLMRNTADTMYDPATGRSYLRLNVDRAMDAIMPTDEYGDSAASAFALGSVVDTRNLSGVIGKLTDQDYFSFTAGASGVMTISASVLRGEMAAHWSLSGAASSVDAQGNLTFNVAAGQSYTLGLTGGGKLGFYNVSMKLQAATPAGVNWGVVEQRQILDQQVGQGRDQFAITATRSGILTIEANFNHAAGNVDFQVYNARGQLIGSSATSTNRERIDIQVTAGETVYLRAIGANRDVDFRLTNLVSAAAGTVTVFGTSGNDVFTFTAGAARQVTVNGVDYQFSAAQATNVMFVGRGGADSATLVGTTGSDTATFRPGAVELRGSGYAVQANGIGVVTVEGLGGIDTAYLYDTAGNDTLTAGPTEARLVGGGVDHTARGFEQVRVYASAGNDVAILRDSAGNDNFVGQWNESRLTGSGFNILVSQFDTVQVTASGGLDQAYFYDSPGVDTFTAAAAQSSFRGTGFSITAVGFERVRAYGKSGQDQMVLVLPGAGASVYNFRNYAQIRGAGYDVAGYNFGNARIQAAAPQAAAKSLENENELPGGASSGSGSAVAAAFDSATAEAWMYYLGQSWQNGLQNNVARDELTALDSFFTRLGRRR